MRTRWRHHCGSITEFIADPVHHAAHPLAAGAIGCHGHLRFDALFFAAEGHVVKTTGQHDLQVGALCTFDLRPAVGKWNAAARIRSMRRLRPIDFRVVFSRSVVGTQVYELAGESRTRSL